MIIFMRRTQMFNCISSLVFYFSLKALRMQSSILLSTTQQRVCAFFSFYLINYTMIFNNLCAALRLQTIKFCDLHKIWLQHISTSFSIVWQAHRQFCHFCNYNFTLTKSILTLDKSLSSIPFPLMRFEIELPTCSSHAILTINMN